MYVIGTAGHVDHGKTLLIKALTGIDTDRLPEEKERGMTIDLGFAYFPGNNEEPVGIIDVPGHERFIRNMVAGAWSLNLALLVVAADDGWMQQSSDHLTVLHYMGIRHLILTITKCDRVPDTRVSEAEQEALMNIEMITGKTVPSVRVSALTGLNIDKLKERILSELKGAPSPVLPYPLFFIDRVFTMKGSGTVVTGSLAGAPLSKQEKLITLPAGREVKIRALQSYHSEVDTALPVSRLALNIGNVKSEELKRGDCITTQNSGVTAADEFLFRLEKTFGENRIRNHSEVEIALGTGHMLGEIHFSPDPKAGWILFKEKLPVSWNQPFIIIRHGGSEILGAGRIMRAGKTGKDARRTLFPIISALPAEVTEKERIRLDLFTDGFIPKGFTEEDLLPEEGTTVAAEGFIFTLTFFSDLSNKILSLAKQGGGIALKELHGKTGLQKDVLDAICSRLIEEKKLILRNSILSLPGKEDEHLSPFAKNILFQAKEAGKAGLEASRLTAGGMVKELKNLAKTGLMISLDGNIFYHPEIYREVVENLVGGYETGFRFSISAAKEKTGLSRKYIIPLLNKMEQDGFVKRDENERVVLRTAFQ